MSRSEEQIARHIQSLKNEFKSIFGAPVEDAEIAKTVEHVLAKRIGLFLDQRISPLNPAELMLAAKILAAPKQNEKTVEKHSSSGAGSTPARGQGQKPGGTSKPQSSSRVLG